MIVANPGRSKVTVSPALVISTDPGRSPAVLPVPGPSSATMLDPSALIFPAASVPRIPIVPFGSLTFIAEGFLRAIFPVTKRKTPLVTCAATLPVSVKGS